jgi:S-DNA-T family DNA segregation ATPase FtsK/SpoIIIE
VFEDGVPVRVRILYRNVLVGGIVGSGKSGVLNVLLAALVACRDVVLWGIDLKGGMELQPWAACLGRLATTPDEAVALLADAVAELDRRTAMLSAAGKRLWQPASGPPALVILVDEYAELPEQAHPMADSIARRGRAVAVTLLAATQRPTQKAMGQGTVRSQMDTRICLRVREPRDADLILGQGKTATGWHAHALDAPGKFLLSDPEHDIPRRARAYLITDDEVSRTAGRYAGQRPRLPAGPASQPAGQPDDTAAGPAGRTGTADPVLTALATAPADGATVADLVTATGLSRATVYRRLRGHARTGRAVPIGTGRWRPVTVPTTPDGSHPE